MNTIRSTLLGFLTGIVISSCSAPQVDKPSLNKPDLCSIINPASAEEHFSLVSCPSSSPHQLRNGKVVPDYQCLPLAAQQYSYFLCSLPSADSPGICRYQLPSGRYLLRYENTFGYFCLRPGELFERFK